MANNNDFRVLLQAVLDSNSIGQDDINKIQKVISKYHLNLTADLDKASVIAEIKKIVPQLEAELKKMTGVDIQINDNALIKAFNQIEKQAESTAQKINKIQLSMDNGHGASEYQNRINSIIASLERYGVETKEAQSITTSLQTTLNNMKGMSGQELVAQADKLEQEFKAVKVSVEQAKLSYDKFMQPASNEKVTSLINRIDSFLTKNTKITTSARAALQGYKDELGRGVKLSRWNEINAKIKEIENSMRGLGRLGASFKNLMSQAAQSFTQWLSVSSGVMFLVSKTKNAVSELKNLDNILTEIDKTSDLSNQQLEKLGLSAYDLASKYGRTASDFLTSMQEMSRSGFYGEKAEGMASQALLAESAGDMEKELANKYVLATNAAYKLNGEAKKLNEILDGQNQVTNTNSVAMADMATAMTEAGTVASSYRVSIEDLTAMIGTIESVTKLGGSEVGNAIKAILINLQNVTSKKIVSTLNEANASMTEMVNGAEKLRDPILILRDLAKTFNELDEDDPLRAKILTNIGQKYHAQKLGALLQNMEMYDKMLVDYSEGEGSALEESNKSAENLTGRLNALNNSWVEFVNNIVNSDELITVVNFFNNVTQGATDLTKQLGLAKIAFAAIFTVINAKNGGGLIRLIFS